VILAVAAALVDFYFWRTDIIGQLATDPDRRVATTPLGNIEYAVVGNGVPVLALHGSPGGYDQSLANLRASPEGMDASLMTIAVSRPGYLGTPLESGATYEEQADLFAALLDELGIDRVIVLASSAGGASGLQFALRHPDRTMGLVLYSAGTKAEPSSGEGPPELGKVRMLAQDFATWAVAKLFPSVLVNGYDSSDPGQAALLGRLMASSVPLNQRRAGARNEFVQYQNPAIDDWPLDDISAPTLIVHGDADNFAPYEHAQYAASRIPNAELVTFEDGGHFIYITDRAEVAGHLTRFIRSLSTDLEDFDK
jgi:pimeloyl-ACP methyl ester carboxylesterase